MNSPPFGGVASSIPTAFLGSLTHLVMMSFHDAIVLAAGKARPRLLHVAVIARDDAEVSSYASPLLLNVRSR